MLAKVIVAIYKWTETIKLAQGSSEAKSPFLWTEAIEQRQV
jgi:hypothetical protein